MGSGGEGESVVATPTTSSNNNPTTTTTTTTATDADKNTVPDSDNKDGKEKKENNGFPVVGVWQPPVVTVEQVEQVKPTPAASDNEKTPPTPTTNT